MQAVWTQIRNSYPYHAALSEPGEGQGSIALPLFLEDGGTAISTGRSLLQLPHGRCLHAGKGLAFVLNKCLQNLEKRKSLRIWKKKISIWGWKQLCKSHNCSSIEISANLLCNGSRPLPIIDRCFLNRAAALRCCRWDISSPQQCCIPSTHRSWCCPLNEKLKAPQVSVQQHWTRTSDALLLRGDAALA